MFVHPGETHEGHDYVLASFEELRHALEGEGCPQPSDLRRARLRAAADYFRTELPAHILAEESEFYTRCASLPGAGEVRHLRNEHSEILDLAYRFHWWVGLIDKENPPPCEEHWQIARRLALSLEQALERHFAHEEAFVRQMNEALPISD